MAESKQQHHHVDVVVERHYVPPNPVILSEDQDKWMFSVDPKGQAEKGPLRFSRECELAMENYELQRHNYQLIEQNGKLKNQMIRIRGALKDSTSLVAKLQALLVKQGKKNFALGNENIELKHSCADSNLTNTALSTGYAIQKDNQHKLNIENETLNKEIAKLKRDTEENMLKVEKEQKKAMAEKDKMIEDLEYEKRSLELKLKTQKEYYSNADKMIEGLNTDVKEARQKLKEQKAMAQKFMENIKETSEYKTLNTLFNGAQLEISSLKNELQKTQKLLEKETARLEEARATAEHAGVHMPRGSFSFDDDDDDDDDNDDDK